MAATKKTKAVATPAAKKPAGRGRKKVTHEMIEVRAYHLAIDGGGGSPLDHWLTAERELLGV